jgi:hypothetical protein
MLAGLIQTPMLFSIYNHAYVTYQDEKIPLRESIAHILNSPGFKEFSKTAGKLFNDANEKVQTGAQNVGIISLNDRRIGRMTWSLSHYTRHTLSSPYTILTIHYTHAPYSPYTLPIIQGWDKAWEEASANLDVTGEEAALKTLGLAKGATLDQVTKAYRKLAREAHPDKNIGKEKEASTKMGELNDARELLLKLYSETGKRGSKSKHVD